MGVNPKMMVPNHQNGMVNIMVPNPMFLMDDLEGKTPSFSPTLNIQGGWVGL